MSYDIIKYLIFCKDEFTGLTRLEGIARLDRLLSARENNRVLASKLAINNT